MTESATLADRVRAGYAVWNLTGQVSDLLPELDLGVELVVATGGPEGALSFRGYEGIAEWARGMGDVWQDLTWEPLEIESSADGTRALVVARVSTRGRASAVRLEGIEVHVYTLGENGKVARIQAFHDVEEARAAFDAH